MKCAITLVQEIGYVVVNAVDVVNQARNHAENRPVGGQCVFSVGCVETPET